MKYKVLRLSHIFHNNMYFLMLFKKTSVMHAIFAYAYILIICILPIKCTNT